jgi:hypothetical protein
MGLLLLSYRLPRGFLWSTVRGICRALDVNTIRAVL